MLNLGAAEGTRYYRALQAPVERSQIQLECSGGENKRAFSIWNGDLEKQRENKGSLWLWDVRSPRRETGVKAFSVSFAKIATVFQLRVFAKHHPMTPIHIQYAVRVCVCVNTSHWRAVFLLPAATQRQLSGLTWPLSLYLSFTFLISASSPAKQKWCLPPLLCNKTNSAPVVWVNNASSDFYTLQKGTG